MRNKKPANNKHNNNEDGDSFFVVVVVVLNKITTTTTKYFTITMNSFHLDKRPVFFSFFKNIVYCPQMDSILDGNLGQSS